MRFFRFQSTVLLLSLLVFAGLVANVTTPVAYAQAISGDIAGVVTDASNAVVPHASVVAKNVATGVSSSATTNSVGEYRIFNLQPGTYDITFLASGFAKSTLKNFAVQLNKVSTANMSLKISASETVEITAEAGVALDTTTAQVETSFSSQQLTELPAATNNVLNLSLMTAGVSTSGGVGQGTGPSVGGQRPTQNNYMVEGIDNNDKAVPGPLLIVPSDAVAEFTTLQNQFSAEYGHSNGGQFNAIIKSGTNHFHGVGYEYFQNRNLNAIDASTARATAPGTPVINPRYDDNRFGGQVGGPIFRNKLFFFSNYEQEPVGQPGAVVSFCAPTAAGFTALAGIPGLVANNLSVYKQYSPVAASQASATETVCHQTATVAGVAIPIGDVGVIAGSYQNNYRSLNSVDYTPSPKDSVRARYLFNRNDAPDTAATFPSFWAPSPSRYHLATFSEFHTFSPTLTNELRIGYNRFYNVVTTPGAFPGMSVFPNITIDDLNGVNIGPDPNGPQGTIQNTYQGSDTAIWVHGQHTIKGGFEFRDVISPQLFVQRQRGDYEYKTLGRYLQDLSPDIFGERNATAPGASPTYYGNQKVIYGFVNDDWRIRKNLTLNLGIRYEYTEVPLGEQAQVLNIAASVPGLVSFKVPTSQKANFVPRFGFSYSVNSSTVVRGGFGIGYDVLYDNLGTLSSPPQQQVTEDVDIHTTTAGFLAGGGLPATAAITNIATQRADTTAFVPDQKLPYAENWSLGIEHTFMQNYTAEVRYIGNRGLDLPTQNRLNIQNGRTPTISMPMTLKAVPQVNGVGVKSLNDVENAYDPLVPAYENAGFNNNFMVGFMPWSKSSYNGLATQLTRRFSHGLLINAAYTWSKTMDDATATAFSTYITPRRPEDFRNVVGDWSRSALNHTDRVTIAIVYDLPFFKSGTWIEKNVLGNWEIAPVYTFQSPEYATVQSAQDSNLNLDTAGDRAYVNPAGIKGTGSAVQAYADPALVVNCPALGAGEQPVLDPYGTRICDQSTVNYAAADPTAYYIQGGTGTYVPAGLKEAGRNSLPMRSIDDFDVTAVKRFTFYDKYKFEFQAQVWNLFNHSQYIGGFINSISAGVNGAYTSGSIHSYLIPGQANFNHPESTFSNNPRNMQLALKFIF